MIVLFNPITAIHLSKEQIRKLGQRIWLSECNGKVEGLTFWNTGEAFPSLGIGHFIWYPQGVTSVFKQTFPDLVKFLIKKKQPIPIWLKQAIKDGCPWKTRDIFLQEKNGARMNELRTVLINTVDLQAKFIIRQFEILFNEIIKTSANKKKLLMLYEQLTKTPEGIFSLIDYVHFKGAGIHSSERYKSKGWGLLQVLEAMDDNLNNNVINEFICKAKETLCQRVANSPQREKEERWLPGWLARVERYALKI